MRAGANLGYSPRPRVGRNEASKAVRSEGWRGNLGTAADQTAHIHLMTRKETGQSNKKCSYVSSCRGQEQQPVIGSPGQWRQSYPRCRARCSNLQKKSATLSERKGDHSMRKTRRQDGDQPRERSQSGNLGSSATRRRRAPRVPLTVEARRGLRVIIHYCHALDQ